MGLFHWIYQTVYADGLSILHGKSAGRNVGNVGLGSPPNKKHTCGLGMNLAFQSQHGSRHTLILLSGFALSSLLVRLLALGSALPASARREGVNRANLRFLRRVRSLPSSRHLKLPWSTLVPWQKRPFCWMTFSPFTGFYVYNQILDTGERFYVPFLKWSQITANFFNSPHQNGWGVGLVAVLKQTFLTHCQMVSVKVFSTFEVQFLRFE